MLAPALPEGRCAWTTHTFCPWVGGGLGSPGEVDPCACLPSPWSLSLCSRLCLGAPRWPTQSLRLHSLLSRAMHRGGVSFLGCGPPRTDLCELPELPPGMWVVPPPVSRTWQPMVTLTLTFSGVWEVRGDLPAHRASPLCQHVQVLHTFWNDSTCLQKPSFFSCKWKPEGAVFNLSNIIFRKYFGSRQICIPTQWHTRPHVLFLFWKISKIVEWTPSYSFPRVNNYWCVTDFVLTLFPVFVLLEHILLWFDSLIIHYV